jgi:prepilin-type N-terminal cleavage/methylation domain-containing protein
VNLDTLRARFHRHRRGGFTLPEILVAIAIFVAISGVVTAVTISVQKSARNTVDAGNVQAALLDGTSRITRDIGYATSIVEADSNRLTVRSVREDECQIITWEAANDVLTAHTVTFPGACPDIDSTTAPTSDVTQTVVEGVVIPTGGVFTYYDKADTTLVTPVETTSQIARVGLDLQASAGERTNPLRIVTSAVPFAGGDPSTTTDIGAIPAAPVLVDPIRPAGADPLVPQPTWNNPTPGITTGYLLFRYADMDGDGNVEQTQVLNSSDPSGLTFDDNLPNGVCARYQVFASTTKGLSPGSNIATYCAAPNPVPDLLPGAVALCTNVSLTWTDVSGEAAYRIYRNGVAHATVAADTTTYTEDAGYNGTFTYRVVPLWEPNPVSRPGVLEEIPAVPTDTTVPLTTCPDLTVTCARDGSDSGSATTTYRLTITGGNANQFQVWTANSAYAPQGAPIYTAATAGSVTATVPRGTTGYWVAAGTVDDGLGNTLTGPQENITCTSRPSEPVVTTAIVGAAPNNDNQIRVSFPPITGATEYQIYWRVNSNTWTGPRRVTAATWASWGNQYVIESTVPATAQTTMNAARAMPWGAQISVVAYALNNSVDTNNNDAAFCYGVACPAAFDNRAGASDPGDPPIKVPAANGGPESEWLHPGPTNLYFSRTLYGYKEAARLAWDNIDGGITYKVTRVNPGGSRTVLNSAVPRRTGTRTLYYDTDSATGLDFNKTYTYEVQATNPYATSTNKSGPVDTGSILTGPQFPAWDSPSRSVNATTGDVTIYWTAPSGTAAGYRIYKNGALLTSVGATARQYTDTSVTPGQYNQYWVMAYNSADVSDINANIGVSSPYRDSGGNLVSDSAYGYKNVSVPGWHTTDYDTYFTNGLLSACIDLGHAGPEKSTYGSAVFYDTDSSGTNGNIRTRKVYDSAGNAVHEDMPATGDYLTDDEMSYLTAAVAYYGSTKSASMASALDLHIRRLTVYTGETYQKNWEAARRAHGRANLSGVDADYTTINTLVTNRKGPYTFTFEKCPGYSATETVGAQTCWRIRIVSGNGTGLDGVPVTLFVSSTRNNVDGPVTTDANGYATVKYVPGYPDTNPTMSVRVGNLAPFTYNATTKVAYAGVYVMNPVSYPKAQRMLWNDVVISFNLDQAQGATAENTTAP